MEYSKYNYGHALSNLAAGTAWGLLRSKFGLSDKYDNPFVPLNQTGTPSKPGANTTEIEPYFGFAQDRKTPQYSGKSLTITQVLEKRKKEKKRSFNMSGHYTGLIPWPKKKPKIQKDKYALYGSRGTMEHTGKVSRPNVNTIGFVSMIRDPVSTTNQVGSVTYHVAAALLRKIFKKHLHADVEYPDQKVSDFAPQLFTGPTLAGPEASSIDFFFKDSATSQLSVGQEPTYGVGYNLPILNTDTFRTLASAIAQNVICASAFGARGNPGALEFSSWRNRELYGYELNLRVPSTSATVPYVQSGLIRLDTQYIQVHSMTKVFFQNVTPSDGSSLDGDAIDANPIKCRMFYFDHPNPVVRHFFGAQNGGTDNPMNGWKLQFDRNGDGMIIPDANLAGTASGTVQLFTQLPTPDMFYNCRKTGQFVLHPGEIKKFILHFSFDGTLNNFIRGLKLPPDAGPAQTGARPLFEHDVTEYSKAMGTSMLFCFDKLINTGSNNTEFNIERKVYTKAILTKRKKITMLPLQQSEVAYATDDTTVGNPA